MWIRLGDKAINIANAVSIQYADKEVEIKVDRSYSLFFKTPEDARKYYIWLIDGVACCSGPSTPERDN